MNNSDLLPLPQSQFCTDGLFFVGSQRGSLRLINIDEWSLMLITDLT